MIISFTNVIGAIQSLVKIVITDNLKMWLGFETSETLGRELVVDGDFSSSDNWTLQSAWSISNNKALYDDSIESYIVQNGLDVSRGKTYQLSFDISDSPISAVFRIYFGTNTSVSVSPKTTRENGSYVITFKQLTNESGLTFFGYPDGTTFSLSNVSLKETQITPDKSGNNNVGSLLTGKALDFDGVEDYVDVSDFSMSGNNATFAFWAYIRDNATGDYFFDFRSSSSRFILGFGQSSQELAVYSGGWYDFGDPPKDQWVRIVLTVKGTIAKCFVNGVQLGTNKTISTFDFSSATTTHIGARYTPETFPKWYDGLLSDFQVYDKSWFNDDIAYDYANPQNLVTDRDNTTIALSNLKAYWAMSEGAGSLTYDSSQGGNNGTIYGATYVDAQPRIPQLGMINWAKSTPESDEVTLIPNPNNTSQDILGNAVRDRLNSFNLDGSGYAEVADDDDLDLGQGDFSVEAWVKFEYKNQGSSVNTIYSNGEEFNDTNTFSLVSASTNNIRFYVNASLCESTSTFSTNQWVHVVGTRIQGTNGVKLYINGNKTPEATATNNNTVTNSFDKTIGRDTSTNRYYNNIISDVRVYSKALSATEVENNYNAGLSAHTN